jgi:hypothetical protein
VRELSFERGEPVLVQLDFAALDQLPCADIVGTLLDRVINVTGGYPGLGLIVQDSLER